MMLSMSTSVYPPDRPAEAIRCAARLGLGRVELGARHGGRMHESSVLASQIVALAAEQHVTLASVHAWGELESLPVVCPRADEWRIGLIVVHCRHERLVSDFAGCVACLTQWNAWCADRNIRLTVENSSRQPLEPFVRLFDAVPGLGLTLDVKHAYKPKLFGLTHVDYLAKLASRLANMHILGIDPARDDELGDGIPPGRDVLDWRQLACDLRAMDYRGLVTVETTLPDMPPADLERAYAQIVPAAGERCVSDKLARHAVDYFRRQFSANAG